MSDSVIDDFVKMVIYDHSVATGLKSCKTDQDIVDFANSRNYFFQLQLGFSMLNLIQLV